MQSEMALKPVAPLIILTALLIGLPMLGATSTGHPISLYLEFPPHTRYVQHAPFSWSVFAVVGTGALLAGALFIFLYRRSRRDVSWNAGRHQFPWWGWVSGFLIICSWILAWTRFQWLEPLRYYSFTPLWVSYVVFVNALTYRRTGSSLLTHRTRFLLSLFPASSLFWWYFEYLNMFAQNWYYQGQELFTPLGFVVHATIAFSTVLPAVVSTVELLESYPALGQTGFRRPLVLGNPRAHAGAMLALASFGLIGIAASPEDWYPVLWVSPLLIVVSLQMLLNEDNLFQKLQRGEWQAITVPALAALICGFFWEMWNKYSYPKWSYSIPYIQRFEIFEMPLLGYLGYLPFGLQCRVVADLVARLASPQKSREKFKNTIRTV
ncbi:MAG TPA: hypothetical protein VE860_21005 [Chthoniobacterales bacterium]|nr:hypothetical protein [Chthoniobacterales bacterium]